jgi:type IV pilus assembly protein PilA
MNYVSMRQRGFTLLEILLVVAAISILAGIVVVAINPARQLALARNAQRQSDVNAILNAIQQYALDNNGNPAGLTSSDQHICLTGASSCSGLLDLHVLTDSAKYLTTIPRDLLEDTAGDSGYTVSQNTNGRLTVKAPLAEQGATVSVTR